MQKTLYLLACRLLPFSLARFLLKLLFRVEVRGIENFAKAGNRVLIISNHVSILDPVLIAAFLPERVLFAVDTKIAGHWWLRPYWSAENRYALDQANPMTAKMLIDAIKQGRKSMIFPEGRVTNYGGLMKVYEGPGVIADKSDAQILPICIEGMQLSRFSGVRNKTGAKLFPKITITICPPRKLGLPEELKGRARREAATLRINDILGEAVLEGGNINTTLLRAVLDGRKVHGGCKPIIEDKQRKILTYNAFITRAFFFSRLIKKVITSSDKYIGVMMPNTVGTIATLFAIQALGRVTAMINFTAGPVRIASACNLSGMKAVVTSKAFIEGEKLTVLTDALKSAGVRVYYIEELVAKAWFMDKLVGKILSLMPACVSTAGLSDNTNDPAILLFTSGSEGSPKGVLLSHHNILSNARQFFVHGSLSVHDSIFCCLPTFHSFGLTLAALLPLFSGLKTFLYPSPIHYHVVPELIYDTGATVLFGTDTFLSGYARSANQHDLALLRTVVAGAEKLKAETRRAWADKFGVRVVEGYGTTEASPVVTTNSPRYCKPGTIGRVLPGMKVRLEPVEGLENGYTLLIKGPNIMLGYIKEDKPGVLQPPKDGWYDTGDVVSMDEQGYVTILGRIKRFAKIGGEMVSLAAVETVVTSIWPGVKHAAVSIPHSRKGEMIVLLTEYPEAELDILPEHFRAYGLTELNLPKRLIKVKQVPILGSGKTDYIKARQLALEEIGSADEG